MSNKRINEEVVGNLIEKKPNVAATTENIGFVAPQLDKSKIEPPSYEKLYQIPAVYYSSWLTRFGGNFLGKTVLDFGCGEGLATVGISMFCGAEKVVGVDICRDFDLIKNRLSDCDPDLAVPDSVEFKILEPCTNLGFEVFDVIVSWSVLEHVSQDIFDQQMGILVNALKPSGFCVLQVAPLYYSPFGSHLFEACQAWDHLTMQSNLLRDVIFKKNCEDLAAANDQWNCFVTLNRFTANEFTSRLKLAGLEILYVYETSVENEPSKELLSVYTREALTKEQILMVCKKI